MASGKNLAALTDPLHRTSGPRTAWTRVNMAEGIPGVLTPLNWSFWDDARLIGALP